MGPSPASSAFSLSRASTVPANCCDGEITSSEQLSVSRTAYREAVRILAAKGLVDARPKVGTRVNPQSTWHLLDPDVLDWTFESEPDLALLDSLFELRNVVESAAAGMAAQRRSAAHLQSMRTALEGMAMHTLATEAGRQADLDFHTTLLAGDRQSFHHFLDERRARRNTHHDDLQAAQAAAAPRSFAGSFARLRGHRRQGIRQGAGSHERTHSIGAHRHAHLRRRRTAARSADPENKPGC